MPDPGDADDPWLWEVLLQDEDEAADYEIALGGAEARDTAMVRAEEAARAHAGR